MHAWKCMYMPVKVYKRYRRPLEILVEQKQQLQHRLWVCYVCMNDGHLVMFSASLFNTFHEYFLDLCAMLHTHYTLLFVCFASSLFFLHLRLSAFFRGKIVFFPLRRVQPWQSLHIVHSVTQHTVSISSI